MGVRVAVAGASGYAGGELLRLIHCHPDLELGPVAAAAKAGSPVAEAHPHLTMFADRTFENLDAGRLGSADLVFLALPHEESAAVAAVLPAHVPVVDLSASFRLADSRAWAKYYQTSHSGRWTYGLPELPGHREQIRSARRVAAPGCYATAATLALAPLIAAGLVRGGDIVIAAVSGTSGAGRSPSAALLATEVMGAVSAYQVGGKHRHTPEIEQALAEQAPAAQAPAAQALAQQAPAVQGAAVQGAAQQALAQQALAEQGAAEQAEQVLTGQAGCGAAGGYPVVSFTPMLAPMPRGILATCTDRLADPATPTAALRAALTRAYADEPFIHVLPEGRWPSTAATVGSNAVHLQSAADAHAGRAVVIAALDNLGKGAAGQAIQSANLMLGLPETAGLTAHGVAP
ncbi:MAG TPA: N-acetyl-gamma-glutamyl-phosphate reductase [Streptosporangiaceae bacterium]